MVRVSIISAAINCICVIDSWSTKYPPNKTRTGLDCSIITTLLSGIVLTPIKWKVFERNPPMNAKQADQTIKVWFMFKYIV